MRTEVHEDDQRRDEAGAHGASNCPNCGTLMPGEMRFCRACGCRLGEGVEEYTETVRLKDAPGKKGAGKSRKTASAGPSPTSREGARAWGGVVVKPMTAGLGKWKIARACKRMPAWMIWVFVPIIVLSMMGGFFSKSTLRRRDRGAATASSAPRSYLGGEFKTADGGALVEYVSPPNSAADKAGLLGGDLIVSFDGKPVTSESDLSNLLRSTPVGKTVEVIYMRDGETKFTKLTTVSENENDAFREAFSGKSKGFLGVDGDEFRRVQVPGTSTYGVQMSEVYKNRPGYIAGLRDGDIVIEFGGVPIRTRGELNMRIDRATPDSTVDVVVIRGSERLVIPVKMGEE